MREKIFNNWTFTRGMYSVIGIIIMIQSAMGHEWMGVAFGGYFASMGIFAFGCAAGNCYVPPSRKSNASAEDVEFEEIKPE